jgi:hypothetical protein
MRFNAINNGVNNMLTVALWCALSIQVAQVFVIVRLNERNKALQAERWRLLDVIVRQRNELNELNGVSKR